MKTCSTCKQSKPLSDYHKRSSSKDGLQTACKPCRIARVREWQLENPEKFKANWERNSYGSEATLKRRARRYGLTAEELKGLLEAAGGKCTICKEDALKTLVVDHCHASNKVRGLLCERCNQGLGLFRDNVDFMKSAIEYLAPGTNIG